MKQICIIIDRMDVGGAQQIAAGEVRELLRRGWAVTLVTFREETNHSLMQSIPRECERITVPFSSLYDLKALVRLSRLLRTRQPDVIITHLWQANTIGRIAAFLANMHSRLIAFEHNVYDIVKSRKQFFADRLLQWWCKKIAVISHSVRDSVVAHGISQKRIVLIHNAIDVAHFSEAQPSGIRHELGIDDDTFLYLHVGRLVPQKGVDILLRAFARQEEGVLALVGDGIDRAAHEALARELGIEKRAFFLGIRQDIPALMRSADCFVLASRWEGFGIVLVEAMAAGLPIVATRVDGIQEVVEEGKSGLLVPPEDAEVFAEAMRQVRIDPHRRFSLVACGRERARRFSIERHVDEVLAAVPVA